MKQQPNIILCTCDQLRAFEVGCYGNDVIRTPHIDQLASEGIRFETAVSNYPLCMPARSSLISLVGISVPEHIHGRDLSSVVQGQCEELKDNHAIIETQDGVAIRSAGHMCFLPYLPQSQTLDDTPTQLYDLTEGPYQLNNLAERTNDFQTQLKLSRYLQQWDTTTPWMSDK